jgi:hypothetical protein
MGGGTPSNTSSTTKNELPAWAVPYAKDFLGAAGNQFFPGGQITPSPLPNQQVAPFTQDQLAAMGLSNMQTGGTQGALQGAQAANANIASGANLSPDSNPYLQQYYNAAAQPVVQNYEQAVAPNILGNAVAAGGLGSSGTEQAFSNAQSQLGQQLGNLSANIYEPAYEQGLAQQAAAIGQAPALASGQYIPSQEMAGVGQQQQQQAQNVLQTGYQNALAQGMWPYTALQMFGPIIGQATGGSGTSITTSPNPASTSK